MICICITCNHKALNPHDYIFYPKQEKSSTSIKHHLFSVSLFVVCVTKICITCNHKALNPHDSIYSTLYPKQKSEKSSTHTEGPWGSGKSGKSGQGKSGKSGMWTASPSITHAPSVSFVACSISIISYEYPCYMYQSNLMTILLLNVQRCETRPPHSRKLVSTPCCRIYFILFQSYLYLHFTLSLFFCTSYNSQQRHHLQFQMNQLRLQYHKKQ